MGSDDACEGRVSLVSCGMLPPLLARFTRAARRCIERKHVGHALCVESK